MQAATGGTLVEGFIGIHDVQAIAADRFMAQGDHAMAAARVQAERRIDAVKAA